MANGPNIFQMLLVIIIISSTSSSSNLLLCVLTDCLACQTPSRVTTPKFTLGNWIKPGYGKTFDGKVHYIVFTTITNNKSGIRKFYPVPPMGRTTELYIYLETIRPIRTAENFEAVEWATGFSNENGCIEACFSSPTRT